MNYDQAITYIGSLRARGRKRGLLGIARLLALLGNPQESLRFVHVVGTNGKGSTTAMTAAILRAAGHRTGMFISPFILDFRERIQVDGEEIPPEELTACLELVQPHVEAMAAAGECPTEFEVVTALAMVYFRRCRCQVVVLEAGLGGLTDATNVISRSLVSIFCSIGLDHVELLGDTVEKITKEKCGVLRQGSTAVCYPDQDPAALGVMLEQCAALGARLVMGNQNAATIHHMGLDGSRVSYRGLELRIPLIGRHQVYNAINAVETAMVLREQGLAIPDEAIVKGIGGVFFPARMEILHRDPLVLVDGAHNESGAKALGEALELLGGGKVTAIMGMMGDKDVPGVLGHIAPRCRRIFTVTLPGNHRALGAQELAALAAPHCPVTLPSPSLEAAFAAAYESLEQGEALLICGSLYLASDMRPVVREYLSNR